MKEKLRKYCGNLQQEAYIRPITYGDGRAYGMRGYLVKNGPMSFQVMADKCMDVAEFSYEGMNYCFLSKPGLQGRNQYDTNGQEAQRSIMGGLFFTAGLENVGPPSAVDGKDYPMHGRIRTTPAELCSADCRWEDDAYHMELKGQMTEGELFGEHMVLRRKLETVYGEPYFDIYDTVENLGFQDEKLMMLYHFNMGYPLLSEDACLILPSKKVTPRDEAACKNKEEWDQMEVPAAGEPERVYIHELVGDEDGNTFACLYNPALERGLMLEFSLKDFPYFMEWKSMASGDYVCGMEPANFSQFGREGAAEELKNGGIKKKHIRVRVIRNGGEAKAVIRRSIELMARY